MIKLILTLILPAVLILLLKKWRNSKPRHKLPPGPKTLPIIGNLHQMSSPTCRCLTDLSKQYGPLVTLKLCENSAVVVSSPDLARQMLKDLDPTFADKPSVLAGEIMFYRSSGIVFCPYGDNWRQMRKLCVIELLSPKMVRLFQAIRNDQIGRLIKSLRESSGSVVNFTEMILFNSNSIICRAACGGVVKDNETLMRLMLQSTKVFTKFEIADMFPSSRIASALSWTKPRLYEMRNKLDVIMDEIIERHRRNRVENGSWNNSEFESEDLVDVFLRVQEEGNLKYPITNDNIKAVLFDIFIGGTETSSTTIDWAMVELLRHPEAMAKAQAEVRRVLNENNDVLHTFKYLKYVIKETLRLHPPAPVLPRSCTDEQVINGYTIPKGQNVLFNIWAMHRDPEYWEDPEKFEPERFENISVDFLGGDHQFLPFGGGKRMCPGITFGTTTVESVLAQLLYNFDWKLPAGVRAQDLDMIESNGITAARKDKLLVVATPYK